MKSILIIGLGRFGRHMAQKFIEEGNSVLAVEASEERANAAVSLVPNIEIADATDDTVIESLGINNFDICVVAIGDNFQAALEITVLLKDFGGKFIIARASRDVHRKLLLRNGADYVVYAERDMAERLAMKFGAKNIFDYIELNKEIGISVRSNYNVTILATKKEERIYPLMEPEHVFVPDESLLVMGSAEAVHKLTR